MEVTANEQQRDSRFGLTPDLWLYANTLLLRYQADRPHSLRVCAHALTIYDALVDLHVIAPDEGGLPRTALCLGALLHDIGHFVADSGHHRHSSYLIRASDVALKSALPVSEPLRTAVAALALAHRKKAKKRWLRDYFANDRSLFQCAAVLRIADGLDRARSPAVKVTGIRQVQGHVTLSVRALDQDCTNHLLDRKADLWPMAFAHSLYLNKRTQP